MTALQDHPRLRGEKLGQYYIDYMEKGSPPLARGKEYTEDTEQQAVRITPACAGKSGNYGKFQKAIWDHPRLRGEKSGCEHAGKAREGSPPLARGKVRRTDQAAG